MKNIVILIIMFSHVKCQVVPPKPEKCHGSPELMTRRCCVFPPFFKRDIAKACGARFAVMLIDNASNVTHLRREANNPCDHWECILSKYYLLNSEGNLDDDKYFTHLDKWVNLNRDFSTVMLNAKIHCKQAFRLFMPLRPCEFDQLQSCIRNYINVDCPNLVNSKECQEFKEFFDECREYYID